MIDEEDDFGFSFTSEEDLKQIEKITVNNIEEKYKNKLIEMYNMILPLLHNLQKNPEKEYIKWPNRAERVEEFKKKLKEIIDSL